MKECYEFTTGPDQVVKGFEVDEDDCVATLLNGIPEEGGHAPKYIYEKLIRAAFQGGLVAVIRKRQ